MADLKRKIKPVISKFTVNNTAVQHVSRHFDFVLGVDFHWTITPLNWIPLPLPHAFVGVIFDPMDYLHFTITIPFIKGEDGKPMSIPIGGTVYVHGRHKATTTTSVMGIIIPFQHLTGMFPIYFIVDKPLAPHEGEVYYGSPIVKCQGSELSGNQPHHVLTCWSPPMGLTPLPTMPGKIKKNPLAYFAFYSRFLKMYIQIPGNGPVLVGGTFQPHDYTLAEYATRFAGMAVMRGITKGLGKLGAIGLTTFNNQFLKRGGKDLPGANKLSAQLCKWGFEPVNFVTGEMSFAWDDFEIVGNIPIRCSNSWQSQSPFPNMFGNGVFNSFDLKILPDDSEEFAVWIHPEEQIPVNIPYIEVGEDHIYYRAQKIWLERPSYDTWVITYNQKKYFYNLFKDAEYDVIFRISKIELPDGNEQIFDYHTGAYNILSKITDKAGRQVIFDLHTNNKRVGRAFYRYKNVNDFLVAYEYDDKGNLIHVIDPQQKAIEFIYNNENLIVKRINRNGMQYTWLYDEKARVIETTGIERFQHGKIKYYPEKGYNEIIYPETPGKTEKIFYDENYLIEYEEDALGGETWYDYSPFHERKMIASPEGKVIGYDYDNFGNIKTFYKADGEKFQYQYNERGQLLYRSEPSGLTEHWEYDKLHRLKSYTSKDGNLVTYFYEENKRLPYKAIDKKGLEISWKYNEFCQVTESVTSNGRIQQWNYDEYGRLTAYIPEEGKRSLWKRDKMGRVKAIYDIGQKPMKFKYDAYDLPIFATDGQEEWHMEYTPMGSLKKQSRASAIHPDKKAVLHFEYDAYENLSSIKNEKSETYRFLRDKNDAVIEETGFDGQKKKYIRNNDGQVVRTLFADGKQVFYDYDLAGRLVYTNYNDGFWESFQYNKSGLLEEAMNPMEKVRFERNRLGLVTKEIQGEHHVEYEYDESGSLQSLKSSLGAEVSYHYDDIGYLSQVTANNSVTRTGSRDKAWQVMLKYNSTGQETSRAMTGGITSEMEYDHAGRPISQKVVSGNTKKLHTQYQWAEGNRLQSAMNALTGGKTEYAYDTFGSLAGSKYDNGETLLKNPDEVGNLYKTENRKDRIYGKSGKLLKDEKWYYLYDALGNLRLKTSRIQDTQKLNQIQQQEKPKKFSFFIDEIDNEKPSPKTLDYYLRTDIQYTQEDKENYKRLKEQQAEEKISHQQWKQGDWEYQWLPNGMLKAVKKPDGRLVEFEYDALGRRTAKIANGRINRYLWDGNILLHEWNYELKKRPRFSLDDKGEYTIMEEKVENLITWVYEDGSFVPSAKITGDEKYSIISDYIGRPIQAYDINGNTVWETDYDIYGKLRNLKGDENFVPFRQLGQYEDEELDGLYYNRFRYFDNSIGGYISQDPIGLDGNNPNFYAYTHDSNVWVDVFGLNAKPETAAQFEKRISKMTPEERIVAVRGKMDKVAKRNNWTKNDRLSKINKRNIYTDANGNHYSVDTQHGRLEHLNSKGQHLGEYDIDLKQTKAADTSGKHNIRCG